MPFRDPFSKVPLRIKLPLGFIILFLCIMSTGGYFAVSSVYTPLNREIMLRLQDETLALATLFDAHLESLKRRAEDFSSDGFIRAHTAAWVDAPSRSAADLEPLRNHLRVNKLPIVREFLDLQIYDLHKHKILGIREKGPDIRPNILLDMYPGEQRVSAFVSSDAGEDAFPAAVIITPLRDIANGKAIGYLVCVMDLLPVIERVMARYDPSTDDTSREKHLRITDQRGQTLEIPWWYMQALPNGSVSSRNERIGFRLSSPMHGPLPAERSGRDLFRHSYTLSSTGWETTIAFNAENALHPLAVLEGRFAGIAGILTAAILILLTLAVQYVVRPLGELQRMAYRIKEGDFSARNAIRTEDEIGMLARTTNLMAEAIQDRTAHLERTAEDLQKRERELRVQHDLLTTLLQSMTDGVMLIDARGQVMLSNKAAAPLLDLIQHTDSALHIQKCAHHEVDSARCMACMGDPNGTTSCVLTVRDTSYEVLSTRVIIGHEMSKVLVARDITEREMIHRQQAHQERLMVLGKLAAVVAHELNNPLSAISMYNQMMETELAAVSPYREHVEVIRRNTQACQRIIKELLDYARMPQPQIADVDLHGLIGDVVHFLRPFHQKAGIAVEQALLAREAHCWGDATQLQQVLVNVLVNAFQAIEHRDGLVRVQTENSGDGAWLAVTVEDNGIGIDPHLTEEIFEPFFTTKRAGGTGLGLSTSRRIVEAHGGKLELAASRPGKTVFRITMPCVSAHGRPALTAEHTLQEIAP
jgi:signal transduction histidine kinase